MAEEPTFLNMSPIISKHANSVCDGVVARLAVFGIHVNAKACVNVDLIKLTAHVNIPFAMICAEAVAAAKILGIKAAAKVCVATGSHGKAHGKRYDVYVSIMYNKPPGYPTAPEKPNVYIFLAMYLRIGNVQYAGYFDLKPDGSMVVTEAVPTHTPTHVVTKTLSGMTTLYFSTSNWGTWKCGRSNQH
ncbi:hypothetical protein K7432_013910 [Basidiobolus ranarum]|uniref:Uncharacterized protein n=1 Tax=Basidiobolus ranarum TaxID=34480 RepID=A0ABR2VR75_9FUNG